MSMFAVSTVTNSTFRLNVPTPYAVLPDLVALPLLKDQSFA